MMYILITNTVAETWRLSVLIVLIAEMQCILPFYPFCFVKHEMSIIFSLILFIESPKPLESFIYKLVWYFSISEKIRSIETLNYSRTERICLLNIPVIKVPSKLVSNAKSSFTFTRDLIVLVAIWTNKRIISVTTHCLLFLSVMK